jgi:hypothetical protein
MEQVGQLGSTDISHVDYPNLVAFHVALANDCRDLRIEEIGLRLIVFALNERSHQDHSSGLLAEDVVNQTAKSYRSISVGLASDLSAIVIRASVDEDKIRLLV